MTIASSTGKHVYTATGNSRNYPYTFTIVDPTDIKVYVTDLLGTMTEITSNYLVDEDNLQVIYPTVESELPYVPEGYTVTLLRSLPQTQAVDWQNQGYFNAEVLEAALDKLTILVQQIQEELTRAVKVRVDTVVPAGGLYDYLADIQEALATAQAAAAAAAVSEANAATSETNAENSANSIAVNQRLTTAERDAILTWSEGDMIYNKDIFRPQFYDGEGWVTL